ncbi:3-dehydroquinate synthase [Brevibacillus centrosporus]|uniref:3-dehydroquinate synthase n=1 Tax=Brevibacillus centrosporus TaxID=54910 RepID=UPI000F09BA70|nr:3-dehydroquinate synthase [Brevibacillus centrosporus]MEC2127733.1 3-dehydroquinate synthase [Brevibacillus centrosporus]RNB66883.1 3-dehydroquinate synthase [Brevibacillus centrosporus]GED30846.1 3-dehydroquinate synthase [Brevibacillus centrosporus]
MKHETLTVDLGERSYPIVIGEGLLQHAPKLLQEAGISSKSQLLIVTDEHVAKNYLEPLREVLATAGYRTTASVIAAGEQSKSLSVYDRIMTEAIQAGLDRKSAVLALGGGVVGDLAGFVAATYMRGIDFVQLPTTLLAHDSSVGGKVAINHPLGKNLIGAFHQPRVVIYDTSALHTLPKREVAAGFAEVVKHGLISDEAFVDWLKENADRLWELDSELLAKAIQRGCAVKAAIVSEDEREQGKRALLNLGHTFGHAFEALSAYSALNHGEAIAIGMCIAAKVAERVGIAEKGVCEQTERVLSLYHLPTKWPAGLTPEAVLEAMKRDKKTVGGKLALVLPRAIGHVELIKDIDEEIILTVMREEVEA